MKKKLILAFLITNLTISCAKNSVSENANVIKDNLQTSANIAVVQSDNKVKPEDTPLPVFSDANEAVAEGDRLFDASSNEKAIEAYQQAVKLNPEFAEAYFKLGLAYSQLEIEQREAGVVIEEEQPTSTPTKKKNKKEVAPKLTDADKAFENAVKAYKKILDKNPKDDAAQFNLGRAYNKLNEDTEAQKALSQAVKLKPDDGQYQTEYGAILIKLAKYEEALPALKKAVSIDPENLQAQDLLEKAQAGKKRIDFGIKPKLDELAQQQQEQQQQSKKRESPKRTGTSNSQIPAPPKDSATPEKKNTNQ